MYARLTILLMLFGLSAATVPAQITNGSFEDAPDHLNGWTPGPGARVEALQSSNLAPNTVAVPDGAWMAMVSNGPGDVPTAPSGDFDANGTTDYDRSTLSSNFTTVLPGESLCFQWAFLTDEVGPGGQGEPAYDDLFDVTINGISILRGSVRKPGGSSPYADTVGYDGLRYTVTSPGLTDNSDFGTDSGGGRIPWHSFCIAIADPGTYALQFLIADQADSTYDSALLVDDVRIEPAGDPRIQITQTGKALTEFKDGGFVLTQEDVFHAASSANGSTLVFRSTADFLGDNPGLQEQIWIATENAGTYSLSRLTTAVSAGFDEPEISGDGRWIVFASDTDLLPPGNADGNFEIFRYDVAGDSFLQVSATTGCANSQATINDGGTRIAFVSDCDLGFGSGDDEIVYWDGGFHGTNTTGCTNRGPRISRDTAGRYVSFVSDCDGPYGSSNSDGSLEVVQWDALLDLHREVTTSPAATNNDAVSSSADGRYISFVSDVDHEAGQNPAGALVALRYDRNTDSFLQLTDPDGLGPFTATSIDTTGSYIAVERIDFLTGAVDVLLIDASVPRTLFPVSMGSATVYNSLPAVSVSANSPRVAFLSNGDTSGNNPELNAEIWISGPTFDPPDVSIYCSTPNVAIPDRNNQGITDTLTIVDTGIIVDLDVSVVIEHTLVGDLRVTLQHIGTGTQVHLIDRPGRPPGAGCTGDDIDATLDDEALSPLEDECVTPGPVAIDGTFTPRGALDAFDGIDLLGDWRITVSDRRGSNVGTFVEWCLIAATN